MTAEAAVKECRAVEEEAGIRIPALKADREAGKVADRAAGKTDRRKQTTEGSRCRKSVICDLSSVISPL